MFIGSFIGKQREGGHSQTIILYTLTNKQTNKQTKP